MKESRKKEERSTTTCKYEKENITKTLLLCRVCYRVKKSDKLWTQWKNNNFQFPFFRLLCKGWTFSVTYIKRRTINCIITHNITLLFYRLWRGHKINSPHIRTQVFNVANVTRWKKRLNIFYSCKSVVAEFVFARLIFCWALINYRKKRLRKL